MTSPGAPNSYQVQIDSKMYYLQEDSSGNAIHQTVALGRELKEVWDFQRPSEGMGETVRRTEGGYYFTDNLDLAGRGLRLGPKVNTIAMATGDIPVDRIGFFFEVEDTSSNPRLYYYCATSTTNVRVTKFNPVADTRITGTTQPYDITFAGTNCNAGRPDTFDGKPYICCGVDGSTDIDALQELTTVVATSNADTWTKIDAVTAVDMLLVSEALDGRSQLLRGVNGNKIQLCSSDATGGPVTNTNWAPTADGGHDVGVSAPHRVLLGGANAGGIVYLSKAEGLFTFDNTGNSWPVIPWVGHNTTRPRHGVGCFAYGNMVFWCHSSGLWRVIGLSQARPCGPDAIPGYEDVPNITAPRKFQHYSGAAKGEWLYFDYRDDTNDNNSYILACKLNSIGFPLTIHTIVKRSNQIHGLYIDGQNKLRWAENHATAPVIGWIQLGADGSPTHTERGTAATATYEWFGPEVDFGEPDKLKQFRYSFIHQEDGAASVSWQLKAHIDSGAVTSVGSAFTTTAANHITWTVGTNDTGYRLRPRLTATGTGDHDDVDPKILRMTIEARTADVMRMVLTPETPQSRRSRFDIAKILRKLKNAGPVTIREPFTNETFTAYVTAVNETTAGIEVIYERWAVNA